MKQTGRRGNRVLPVPHQSAKAMSMMSHFENSPARLLHTMLRVRNLDRALDFYCTALGMREIRRETVPEGRFTLVFVGYGEEADNTVIELTHNWGENAYTHGTGFGHIAIEVPDVEKLCSDLTQAGVPVIRPAGPMRYAPVETGQRDMIAFITDPDGYRIELVERKRA